MKFLNQKFFNPALINLNMLSPLRTKNCIFFLHLSVTTGNSYHSIFTQKQNYSLILRSKTNRSKIDCFSKVELKKSLNTVLNPVLLVNFPENKKEILLKNLNEEKQLLLITESSQSILNTIRKKRKEGLNYIDPIQFLLRKLRIISYCICVINNFDYLGKNRKIYNFSSYSDSFNNKLKSVLFSKETFENSLNKKTKKHVVTVSSLSRSDFYPFHGIDKNQSLELKHITISNKKKNHYVINQSKQKICYAGSARLLKKMQAFHHSAFYTEQMNFFPPKKKEYPLGISDQRVHMISSKEGNMNCFAFNQKFEKTKKFFFNLYFFYGFSVVKNLSICEKAKHFFCFSIAKKANYLSIISRRNEEKLFSPLSPINFFHFSSLPKNRSISPLSSISPSVPEGASKTKRARNQEFFFSAYRSAFGRSMALLFSHEGGKKNAFSVPKKEKAFSPVFLLQTPVSPSVPEEASVLEEIQTNNLRKKNIEENKIMFVERKKAGKDHRLSRFKKKDFLKKKQNLLHFKKLYNLTKNYQVFCYPYSILAKNFLIFCTLNFPSLSIFPPFEVKTNGEKLFPFINKRSIQTNTQNRDRRSLSWRSNSQKSSIISHSLSFLSPRAAMKLQNAVVKDTKASNNNSVVLLGSETNNIKLLSNKAFFLIYGIFLLYTKGKKDSMSKSIEHNNLSRLGIFKTKKKSTTHNIISDKQPKIAVITRLKILLTFLEFLDGIKSFPPKKNFFQWFLKIKNFKTFNRQQLNFQKKLTIQKSFQEQKWFIITKNVFSKLSKPLLLPKQANNYESKFILMKKKKNSTVAEKTLKKYIQRDASAFSQKKMLENQNEKGIMFQEKEKLRSFNKVLFYNWEYTNNIVVNTLYKNYETDTFHYSYDYLQLYKTIQENEKTLLGSITSLATLDIALMRPNRFNKRIFCFNTSISSKTESKNFLWLISKLIFEKKLFQYQYLFFFKTHISSLFSLGFYSNKLFFPIYQIEKKQSRVVKNKLRLLLNLNFFLSLPILSKSSFIDKNKKKHSLELLQRHKQTLLKKSINTSIFRNYNFSCLQKSDFQKISLVKTTGRLFNIFIVLRTYNLLFFSYLQKQYSKNNLAVLFQNTNFIQETYNHLCFSPLFFSYHQKVDLFQTNKTIKAFASLEEKWYEKQLNLNVKTIKIVTPYKHLSFSQFLVFYSFSFEILTILIQMKFKLFRPKKISEP